ncbi:MAG: CXXX repeat peptide maturase [Duncaniella sp.]|uniref:CXXX repeat peptide maturase n=1 Tax=Duncaniella sp. TaxID=2518496 RepID=UPI0023BD5AFF|nr:CXXX repeat peptide maturase [Duncaniella sp.]MDE5987957.1 CXXX repeat peptide maturase [Duncaniella sp.]
MIKYLIIQLDDTSVSYCHYSNPSSKSRLIPLETLKSGIEWGMKENVTFQFLFPDYELPQEYKDIIETVYHASIMPYGRRDEVEKSDSDVIVISDLKKLELIADKTDTAYVVRGKLSDLIDAVEKIKGLIEKVNRVTVIPTDVEKYNDSLNEVYGRFLDDLAGCVKEEYTKNHYVQFNLLTDRIILDKMNNCNAGYESISLCPDGKFYLCPAFYFDGDGFSVGDIEIGLDIKNRHLYKLEYAPICRTCDSWQCKRCVWLNRKMTLEVNTPSHEQCVMAHIERNASRLLLANIREIGQFLPGKEIPELTYLDPFDKFANN